MKKVFQRFLNEIVVANDGKRDFSAKLIRIDDEYCVFENSKGRIFVNKLGDIRFMKEVDQL